MKKFLQSKAFAWIAFIVALAYLVMGFKSRSGIAWWAFIDVFFVFMAAFLNLVMCYVRNVNRIVADKLNTWVFVFGILFILAFIGEYIAIYVMF